MANLRSEATERATWPLQAAWMCMTAMRVCQNLKRWMAILQLRWMMRALFCCRVALARFRASMPRVYACSHGGQSSMGNGHLQSTELVLM